MVACRTECWYLSRGIGNRKFNRFEFVISKDDNRFYLGCKVSFDFTYLVPSRFVSDNSRLLGKDHVRRCYI